MVKRFLFVYHEAVPQNEVPGWTRHQIVTLASIIEKETGAPEERPLISSVFHNRLKKGMRLQTDPTVLYGKAERVGSFAINITTEDLRTPNRYNTYTIYGLPPGPIANPGREALSAVLAPAESTYLYFVSQNNGTHIFSSDYEAHNKAVKHFQLDPKAREGKSWRDLSKKKVEAPAAAPAGRACKALVRGTDHSLKRFGIGVVFEDIQTRHHLIVIGRSDDLKIPVVIDVRKCQIGRIPLKREEGIPLLIQFDLPREDHLSRGFFQSVDL